MKQEATPLKFKGGHGWTHFPLKVDLGDKREHWFIVSESDDKTPRRQVSPGQGGSIVSLEAANKMLEEYAKSYGWPIIKENDK